MVNLEFYTGVWNESETLFFVVTWECVKWTKVNPRLHASKELVN